MPRLMAVTMTPCTVIAHHKTVTRRKGWLFLSPGDRLTLCRKVQGREPGEPLERLAEVEVVSVRREPLSRLLSGSGCPRCHGLGLTWVCAAERYRECMWCQGESYPHAEMRREGFPLMDPAEFVERFFVQEQRMDPSEEVTRIEWRYL